MRLFIAINFTPDIKQHLSNTIQLLSKEAIRGNFTRTENMHLTLAFLGEVSSKRVPELLQAMNEAAAESQAFQMKLEGFGKFRSRGENLYWYGVQNNSALIHLQQRLIASLKANDFHPDEKTFKPHITLGRRCVMKKEFDEKAFAELQKAADMRVDSISLMLSEHKNGKLVYSCLGAAKLPE